MQIMDTMAERAEPADEDWVQVAESATDPTEPAVVDDDWVQVAEPGDDDPEAAERGSRPIREEPEPSPPRGSSHGRRGWHAGVQYHDRLWRAHRWRYQLTAARRAAVALQEAEQIRHKLLVGLDRWRREIQQRLTRERRAEVLRNERVWDSDDEDEVERENERESDLVNMLPRAGKGFGAMAAAREVGIGGGADDESTTSEDIELESDSGEGSEGASDEEGGEESGSPAD